ncbi:MAG: transposase [Leptolyngbyaceae cyanobacterium]
MFEKFSGLPLATWIIQKSDGSIWTLLKRCLKGTYVSVEPFHLHRYLDEQAYRYNNRKSDNTERFLGVVGGISDKRYKQLIGDID